MKGGAHTTHYSLIGKRYMYQFTSGLTDHLLPKPGFKPQSFCIKMRSLLPGECLSLEVVLVNNSDSDLAMVPL